MENKFNLQENFSENLLLEINSFRNNPYKYYKKLENILRNMKDSRISISNINFKINNIKNALDLLKEIKLTKKLRQLNHSNELASSTSFFLNTCILKEDINEISNYLSGISGQDLVDHVMKYCSPVGIVGISYDINILCVETVLLSLLLDEKNNTKINRNLLLNNELMYIGISCAYLKNYDKVLVIINYCHDFLDNKEMKTKINNNLNDSYVSKSSHYSENNYNNSNEFTRDYKQKVNNTISIIKNIPNRQLKNQSLNNTNNSNMIRHTSKKELIPLQEEELYDHIQNSEKEIESIKVEKKYIYNKNNRGNLYLIKKILYTSGEYEEFANKL